MIFDQIKIVLLHTTHPGNIGAVARAMKNMGFRDLCLVSPKHFPDPEATARASGAEDLLAQAVVVGTLEEAVADCHWVMGLSARVRKIAWPVLHAREAASKVATKLQQNPALKIALLFGQEQSGLSNEELAKCQYQIVIPANTEYASLNLAQAVQIMTYEFRMAFSESQDLGNVASVIRPSSTEILASTAEMESFYTHLEKSLIQLQFLDPKSPGYLMQHLRRLYAKSNLTQDEINILRGILGAIDKG